MSIEVGNYSGDFGVKLRADHILPWIAKLAGSNAIPCWIEYWITSENKEKIEKYFFILVFGILVTLAL